MTNLAVPIAAAQIHAATSLRAYMPGWRHADDALDAVAARFPDWDMPSILVKVVTVNELYATRLLATARMAEHIHGLLQASDHRVGELALVHEVAALPAAPGKKQRHHRSFASKFAHYFLDATTYPIYDELARQMLRYHLGRGTCSGMDDDYGAFVEAFGRFRTAVPEPFSARALDRYLWLGGAYRAWVEGRRSNIGAESSRLFSQPVPAARRLLDRLRPAPTAAP